MLTTDTEALQTTSNLAGILAARNNTQINYNRDFRTKLEWNKKSARFPTDTIECLDISAEHAYAKLINH